MPFTRGHVVVFCFDFVEVLVEEKHSLTYFLIKILQIIVLLIFFYEGVWGGVQMMNDMTVKMGEIKMDDIFLLMMKMGGTMTDYEGN